MPAHHPVHSPIERKKHAHKRRLWPGLLLAALVVLAVLGLWLSGPGMRVVGTYLLRNQLENAGLTGDFTVDEIGLGAARLSDVNLEGPGLVRSIRGDSLAVDYRLGELRRGRIRALEAENFQITLDLDAAPERDDEPFDVEAFGETLRGVREQLAPVDLNAENVTITLLREDEAVAALEGADIRHARDSGSVDVRFDRIDVEKQDSSLHADPQPVMNDGNGAGVIPNQVDGQDVKIDWGPDGLRLDRLELVAGVVLENLALRHPEGGDLEAEGVARVDGAVLRIRLEENLRIARLVLEEGVIDIGTLLRRMDQEADVAGTVDVLDLTVRDIIRPPGQWGASGSVEARSLTFDQWDFDDVELRLEKVESNANINLSGSFLGTAFALHAEPRFAPELAEDARRWWHDAAVSGSLESENLEPALAELRRRQAPEAEAPLIPQGRVGMNFAMTLLEGDPVQASADYTLRDLAVEGEALPPVNGQAAWDWVAKRLEASLRHRTTPEAEEDALRLRGSWEHETERYEGSADFQDYDLSVLAGFLRPIGINMPSGTITGSWEGSGVFNESDQHTGRLELAEGALDFSNRPPVSGRVQARYEWPGEVQVETLQIAQEDRSLELSGSWSNGRAGVDTLSLRTAEQVLLRGQASVPLARDVRSFEEFLAADGEVSGEFETSGLPLALLRDLLPGVEIPASGVVDGVFEMGGTLTDPVVNGEIQLREFTAKAFPNMAPTDVALSLETAAGRLKMEARLSQDEAVLDAQADVPLTTNVRSLADFLSQEEEISILLETTDFPVVQLEQFLPDNFIPLPEDGVVDGTVTVTGTFEEPTVTSEIEVRDLSFVLPDDSAGVAGLLACHARPVR